MIQRGFHHCLWRRAAELFEDMLFHRTRVDADADRDLALLRRLHDRMYAVRSADVAGIEPDFIHARLNRGERKSVIKMDIRYNRNRRVRADFFERFRRLCIRHGTAHNIAARFRERTNLRQRRFCVTRVRIGHGLHRNRCAAANRYIPHQNLLGLFHVPVPPIMMRKISCPVT